MLPRRDSVAVWAAIPRQGRGILGFFALVGLVILGTTVLVPLAVSAASQPQALWVQVGDDIDGEAFADLFGDSVAMSADGSRVAVGAYANDGGGDSAGHVRVFDSASGVWVQVGGDIDGENAGDQSGWSVAISADGSRVAVGAPSNDDAGTWAGHVRVFDLVGGVWVQVGGDIDGEAPNDLSGWAVSLSADGSRVAVGARSNDGGGNNAGHVRVFDLVGGVWVQVGGDIDGENAGDQSGWSVAISADGSRVAVGAYVNDGGGNNAGHVRVFDLVGGVWVQVGGDIDGQAPNDLSGWAVSLSADGSRVAIGSNGFFADVSRVFDLVGGVWVQVGGDIDEAGWAVSLSSDGARVAVSTRREEEVGVFELSGGSWQQVGGVMSAEVLHDEFGRAVSLSGDGERVGIGARANNGAFEHAGHVRVFELGISEATCQGKPVTNDMRSSNSGIGTANDDVISGTDGFDVIDGRGGNDTICALGGDDRVLGGDGDDLIEGGDGVDTIIGGPGDDTIFGGFGIDYIYGEDGEDILDGEGGSDRIYGGAGNDLMLGDSGADRMYGGDGDDEMRGMGGQDFMWGEAGNDLMQGNFQTDNMFGGPGDDTMFGAGGKDSLFGEAGNDSLSGGPNTDYLDGGDDVDAANGGQGHDKPVIEPQVRASNGQFFDGSGCIAETIVNCQPTP